MKIVERRVEVPVVVSPTRLDWPSLLDALVAQIDNGRIYDRNPLDLSDALGVPSSMPTAAARMFAMGRSTSVTGAGSAADSRL
ncbi:hypothetical protein [Blastococcus sp. TF02A-26]|uniref:hypothetical protein n=1 Tax=Blastococcus sp. TF02A-26 TaxID=2250577 RepID=UPI000DE98135|nr:hypothetical protein [Blastococcus sp. TF02A-26]RBY83111.1 hypothetical protein DQ240_16995 [Blastococcus sp. TF02A-26]